MKTKNLMLSLLIAAGVLILPVASQADSRVSIGVTIGTPPPAVAYAPAPAPRPGYAWAPGYWGWNGYQHVWVQGHWMRARPGYAWVPDRWERRGPNWHHVNGHWDRGRHNGRGNHRH